jgi:hypothetical protein
MNLSLEKIMTDATDKDAVKRAKKIQQATKSAAEIEAISELDESVEMAGMSAAVIGHAIVSLTAIVALWMQRIRTPDKKKDISTLSYLKDYIKLQFEKGKVKREVKNIDKVDLMNVVKKHSAKLGALIRNYLKEPNDNDLEGMAKYFLKMSKEDRHEALKLVKGEN